MTGKTGLTVTGKMICFCLFAIGFVFGWQYKKSDWDRELAVAADSIAASEHGMYVPEFYGVVYMSIPPESTESDQQPTDKLPEQILNQIRDGS